jgi:beta-glucosidase
VLFGDVNPGGKLPITFPRDESHTPVATAQCYPGVDGKVHYAEGVDVGYRGYERLGLAPQYAFGHGLSYTSFAYSDLGISPGVVRGTEVIRIDFELENTGSCAGVEVAQVYAGTAAGTRRLVGWARVLLEPRERRQVSVMVDPQSGEHPVSEWNVATRSWQLLGGEYHVHVGASSRDIRLEGQFNVNPAQGTTALV